MHEQQPEVLLNDARDWCHRDAKQFITVKYFVSPIFIQITLWKEDFFYQYHRRLWKMGPFILETLMVIYSR